MELGLPNLPYEIVFDIFSRLPVKSLCRFKSVSKTWLAQITDPQFIKSRLNQSMKYNSNQMLIIDHQWGQCSKSFYSIDYRAPDHTVAKLEMPCKSGVEIFGSLNGVILLSMVDGLRLWNPSIRTYQKISEPKHPDARSDIIYGLGYDSISDDFKVVAAFFPVSEDTSVVHVFSSKLRSWKKIGVFAYCIYLHGPGCILNGAPHWFVSGITDMYLHIVCFDDTEEKFKEVPKPIDEIEDDRFILGVLGGWLCVVDHSRGSHSDVWVMKEYGVKESWTKLFVVPLPIVAEGEFFFHCFELFGFTKGEEVIMKLDKFFLEKLVIYNPKQNTYKRIGIPYDCKHFDATLYVESLVSPHGCNDTRRYC